MRQCGRQRPQPPPGLGTTKGHRSSSQPPPYPPPSPPIRSAPGPMPPDLPVPITRPRTLGAAGGRAEPAAPGTPPGRWEWEGGGPAAGAARIASPVQDRTRLCPRGAAGGCPRISFLPLPLTSLLCPSTYACRCHRYPAIRAAQLLPGFLPIPPHQTLTPSPAPRQGGGKHPLYLSLPLWNRDSRSVTTPPPLIPHLSTWGCCSSPWIPQSRRGA